MRQLIIISIVIFSSAAFAQDTARYIPYPEIRQSIGIVYEASSFNPRDFFNYEYSLNAGMIKNVFLSYSIYLSETYLISLKTGYGWNTYTSSNSDLTYKSDHKINTTGTPLELEFKYQHYITKDSVFEPLIGIGLGYYTYKTKNIINSSYSPSEQDYKTNGFAQYILFGMNLHMSKQVISSIQLKKIMVSNISTNYESMNSYSQSYEIDYSPGNGLSDISLALGIYYYF